MTQLAIRLDSEAEMALDRLVRRSGQSRSEIVRQAISAFDRAALIEQMREDSRLVRDDPEDLAEAQAVLQEMSGHRAW